MIPILKCGKNHCIIIAYHRIYNIYSNPYIESTTVLSDNNIAQSIVADCIIIPILQ